MDRVRARGEMERTTMMGVMNEVGGYDEVWCGVWSLSLSERAALILFRPAEALACSAVPPSN